MVITCWLCNDTPPWWGLLEDDHGNQDTLTTDRLKAAADAVGVDIGRAVANATFALSHFDPDFVPTGDEMDAGTDDGFAGLQKTILEADAGFDSIQKALGSEFLDFMASLAGDVNCDVFKSTGELQYTLGVAYAANRADPHRGADGHRDFASAEVLRNGAWSYIVKGASVGLDHKQGTDGSGIVVESYLWPESAPDWPQANGYVVKSNDWLLGVVWSDEAWKSIREGKRKGFSIQGAAHRRAPSTEALAGLREN